MIIEFELVSGVPLSDPLHKFGFKKVDSNGNEKEAM